MAFYSQDGQDKFLAKLFKNKRNGFFLDIGAYDGVYYSNSFYFEKNLGWDGICVEPNPSVFQKLKANRNCTLINCGIGQEEGRKSNFLIVKGYGEMLSGLIDCFDSNHQIHIDKIISEHGGSKELIQIPTSQVKTILKENGIKEVDYCNIDVEGGEISVLKSIDFASVRIKVFTIENNNRTDDTRKFLRQRGYKFIWRLGSDEVYEYHSKRLDLMVLWRLEKIKNNFFLFGLAVKRRIFKG